MRGYIITSLLLLCTLVAWGQQRPQLSQYMNAPMLINPAVTGTAETVDFRGGLRRQWAGFTDAPRTFYLTFQTVAGRIPPNFHNRVAGRKFYYSSVGGVLLNDVTGPTSRLSGYFNYAYHQSFGKNLTGSFGIMAGLQQFSLNGDKLLYRNQSQGLYQNFSKVFPDAGVGLFLYGNKAWAGVSVQQIFRNQFSTNDFRQDIYIAHRLMYGSFGTLVKMRKDWYVIPSILVKKSGPAPISMDANFKIRYQGHFWFGGSYRLKEAVVAMIGVQAKQLEFGYSYDFPVSDINTYTSGSHEIFVGYRLAPRKTKYNPADFWR